MVSRSLIQLTLTCLALTCDLVAQVQLQFSQAIVHELSGVAIGNTNDVVVQTLAITVPANRVWKIESVHHSTTKNSGGGDVPSLNHLMVTLNDVLLVPQANGLLHPGMIMAPIWLPPGSYTLKLWQGSEPTIVQVRALLSILEFYTL